MTGNEGDTFGVNPHAPEATGRPRPGSLTTTITYDGQAGTLFGLGTKIALLSLLTLGFYRFWGKTRVRRYLASRISLMGDRFEYTGTGKELFLGFMIALAVLIPLGVASYTIDFFLTGKLLALHIIVSTLQYGFILFLIGYATFRARRYRLSRTMLRGIRFWQTGSNVGYALRMMGYFALTIITLGIARPIGDIALYRYLLQHTWFGSQNFEFEGRAGDMMGKWILSLLLAPLTLGLSLIWYAAYRMSYVNSQTRYQGVQFSLSVKMSDLIRIYTPYALALTILFAISSIAVAAFYKEIPLPMGGYSPFHTFVFYAVAVSLVFFFFGVVAPVLKLVLLTHKFVGLIAERLTLTGDTDLNTIMQSAAERPESGEGLADALDIGGGLEVGI